MTDQTQWLEDRRKGVGGSDVAAILGLSPYRTPVATWLDKTGQDTGEEVSEKSQELMHWGHTLEDVVAKEFQERTGMKVQRVNKQLVTGESGWMRANLDRAIVNPEIAGTVRVLPEEKRTDGRMLTTDVILECKTAHAFSADKWGPSQEDEIIYGTVVTEHKIPLYYETQVQWYLGITGAKTCYVAVLIGGNDFRIYKVDRDEEAIRMIVEKCREFWFGYVLTKKEPAPINIDDIRALYKRETGPMIECSNEAAVLISEYRNVRQRIAELKTEQDDLSKQIAEFIGPNEGLLINGEKAVTFKSQTRKTTDSTKLKKVNPTLWADLQKESTTRILRVL